MEDSSLRSRPPYSSYLFLGSLTVWLVGFRHGFAPHDEENALRAIIALTGIYVAFWLEWSIHGFLPAVAAAVLLWFAPHPSLRYSSDLFYPMPHITLWMLVAVFGMLLWIWSELDRPALRSGIWIAIAGATWTVSGLIWVEAATAQAWIGLELSKTYPYRDADLTTAAQRIRQTSMVFLILGGLFGVRFASGKSRIIAATTLFLAPLAGFALARLYLPVSWESLWEGSRWEEHGETLKQLGDFTVSRHLVRGWTLFPAWLVVPMTALGIWRSIGRGRRQHKKGRMPLAWLFSIMILVTGVLGFPLLTAKDGTLPVVLLGAVLPVFAVADFALLFYERIVLPTPRIGPSDVPHIPHP